jgi:RES domain-containing protein
MPTDVYRVCRAIFSRLDGGGAKLAGGRWNSPGRSVVYMAESVPLAVLENLVHMSRTDFPKGYVVAGAALPDAAPLLTEVQLRIAAGLVDSSERAVGDYWIEHDLSAVLQVPSAVVQGSSNFLLNPAHPGFRRIVAHRPIEFQFDPRLFGKI